MAVNNSLAPQRQVGNFSGFITSDAVKNKVNQMIGGKDGDRFIASIISAVSTNTALSAPDVDRNSILSCALLGESLKLSPSPQLGYYYIIPYADNKAGCKVATFQMGYKGYIQLAMRSGCYKRLNVISVKEGELKHYDPFTEEIQLDLIEDDTKREAMPTMGYCVFFEYLNGFRKLMYWSKAKMMSHADRYSKAFNVDAYTRLQSGQIPQSEMWKYSSFWYKDFDGMAYKTMIRQLLSKWGMMSIEMQNAFDADMATVDETGRPQNYVDNDGAGNLPEPEKQPEPVIDEDGGDPFANAEPVQSSDDEYKLQEILDHIAIATNRAELSGAKMEGKQYGLNAEMMSKIEKAIQKRTLSIG